MQILFQHLEKYASETPNSIAVQFETERALSYKQLNEKVNRWAHYLRAQGVNRQQHVLVLLSRSTDWVVATLALAKLGAVYIPFDGEGPISKGSHFESVVADCSPAFILTQKAFSKNYASFFPRACHMVAMDDPLVLQALMASSMPNMTNVNSEHSADDIAYIVYSSGTTGKPKGIPIKAAGLDYWVGVLKEKTSLSVHAKVLATMSISFDASIWELLMAFAAGGSLHITSSTTRSNPHELVNFIETHRITDATLVPAQLKQFDLSSDVPRLKASGLQAIYFTGESCTLPIIAAWINAGVQAFNAYGSTELTFGYSMGPVTLADIEAGKIPISSPVAPVKGYVIDDNLQMITEPGQEGTLYTFSPFLTSGYLKRPDETAKKFLELKIGASQVQVYNTGDRVSIGQRGELYYRGRADENSHLKINGVKVEPLDIEEHLLQQQGIKAANLVVVDSEKEARLVIFLVFQEDVSFKDNILRKKLCEAIPGLQGIRLDFKVLFALPLLQNGKTDKQALKKLALEEQPLSVRPKAFLTPLQQKILQLIEAIIQAPSGAISLNDELLYVGLSSLSIVRLVGKINELLNIRLPLSAVYIKDQTIAAFVRLIQQTRWQTHPLQPQLLVAGDKKQRNHRNVFLLPPVTGESCATYAQFATALSQALKSKATEEEDNAYNVSFYTFDMRFDPLDIHDGDLNAVAVDFIQAIRAIQPNGDYRIIGWSSGGVFAHIVASLLEKDQKRVKFLGLIDAMAPAVLQCSSAEDHAAQLITLMRYLLVQLLPPNSKQLGITKDQLYRLEKIEQIDFVVDHLFSIIDCETIDDIICQKLHTVRQNLKGVLGYIQRSNTQITPTLFVCESSAKEVAGITHDLFSAALLGWMGDSIAVTILHDEDHFNILLSNKLLAKLADALRKNLISVARRNHTMDSSSSSSESDSSSPPDESVLKLKLILEEQEQARRRQEEQRQQIEELKALVGGYSSAPLLMLRQTKYASSKVAPLVEREVKGIQTESVASIHQAASRRSRFSNFFRSYFF